MDSIDTEAESAADAAAIRRGGSVYVLRNGHHIRFVPPSDPARAEYDVEARKRSVELAIRKPWKCERTVHSCGAVTEATDGYEQAYKELTNLEAHVGATDPDVVRFHAMLVEQFGKRD
jgi:hypothetical protein